MSVGLVCGIAMARHVVQWNSLATAVGWTAIGTLNALVGVRSLFSNDAATTVVVAVRRASRAAADAEEPEQARGQGECDGKPGDHKHVLAKGSLDVEWLQASTDGSGHNHVEGSRSRGSSKSKECGDLG